MEASRALQFSELEGADAILRRPLIREIQNPRVLDGGLVQGDVPLHLVYSEDVPVDRDNVEEIRSSLRSEAEARHSSSGQLSPVILAEVVDIDLDLLLVVDGFHRTAIAKEEGYPTLDSRVRTGSTMEEVIDLRIQTAATHRALRFARINEWMGDAWEHTAWKDQLTPLQAFSLINGGVSKHAGRSFGLSPAETKEVAAWAQAKCKRWDLSPASVCMALYIASASDPELVKNVRERRGRHTTLEALTAQHLLSISTAFPNNYEMQQLASGIVLAHNLTVNQTNGLVDKLIIGDEPAEVEHLIEDPKFIPSIVPRTTRNSSSGNTKNKKGPGNNDNKKGDSSQTRSPHYKELATRFVEDELRIAILSLESLVFRGIYVPDRAPQDQEVLPRHQLVFEDFNPKLPREWSGDRNESAVEHLEKLHAIFVRKLSERSETDKKTAPAIVGKAERRILQDTQTGALRFLEADDNKMLSLVMWPTIMDEIALRNRQKRNEALGITTKPQAVPESNHRSVTVQEHMTGLHDPRERQASILNGVYKLSPFIIRQAIGGTEAHVVTMLSMLTQEPEI